MAPDVARSFQQANEAAETYVGLYGTFDFDPAAMPQGIEMDRNGANLPAPEPVLAKFRGQGLTPRGWEGDLRLEVLLMPTCAGPWCGSLEPGDPILVFAQRNGTDYAVEVGPCGGWAFVAPDEATLDQATACMAGGECTPKDPY